MIYHEVLGSGEPLLLLHGLGSCGADWLFQLPAFSKKFTVITPDFRGHGKSTKIGPFTVDQCAKDMHELIQKFGPLHVIGFSYGAFVALKLAIEHPEYVKSLVLVSATSRIRDMGFWALLYRRILLSFAPMNLIAKAIAKSLFPDPEQLFLRKECEARLKSNKKSIYKAFCHDLADFDVSHALSKIKCPVRIVVGQYDALLPIHHAEKILHAVPQAQLSIIKGAGHAVPLDSAEEFTKLVLG